MFWRNAAVDFFAIANISAWVLLILVKKEEIRKERYGQSRLILWYFIHFWEKNQELELVLRRIFSIQYISLHDMATFALHLTFEYSK